MNEIQTTARQLPDNIEDLSKFVLIGREKLNAVRAEIRAIKAVELAAEVHEQKLAEAQDIAEAVLDAEAKLGELTAKLEKSVGGRPSETNPNGGESLSKKQQLADLGITHAERYETLAKHPEQVEQAKADARAEGRIVTRSDVLMRIAPPKSRDQTMREFKQQAREEHEEFKQAMQDDVVDFAEVKKDKENLEIIALDVSITINKALAGVLALGMLKEKEIQIMCDHMKSNAIHDMTIKGRDGIRTITRVLQLINKE